MLPPDSSAMARRAQQQLRPLFCFSASWTHYVERGFATCDSGGFLKIGGLRIDDNRYGGAGRPYRAELWTDSGLDPHP